MKTMYIYNGANMVVDTKTQEISSMDSCREAISRIYKIEEDTDIIVKKNDGSYYNLKGSAGDILIVFYENYFENPAVLISSKEWSDNLDGYARKIQKEKEEWAKRNADKTVNTNDLGCGDACDEVR